MKILADRKIAVVLIKYMYIPYVESGSMYVSGKLPTYPSQT